MFLRVRIAYARCAAASHRHLYMVWVGVDPGNPPLAVVAIRRPSSSVVVHRRRASSGSPWGHFSSSCAALVSGPKSNPRRGAIMGPFCRFTIRLRDGVGPGGGQEADPNQGPQRFWRPACDFGATEVLEAVISAAKPRMPVARRLVEGRAGSAGASDLCIYESIDLSKHQYMD